LAVRHYFRGSFVENYISGSGEFNLCSKELKMPKKAKVSSKIKTKIDALPDEVSDWSF
jgi:hypothetical protein